GFESAASAAPGRLRAGTPTPPASAATILLVCMELPPSAAGLSPLRLHERACGDPLLCDPPSRAVCRFVVVDARPVTFPPGRSHGATLTRGRMTEPRPAEQAQAVSRGTWSQRRGTASASAVTLSGHAGARGDQPDARPVGPGPRRLRA